MRLYNLAALILACFASLFPTSSALAVPPLPSSFYGTASYNNLDVPDGTVVQALIDGQVYAQAYTLTYQGDSVYALDVLGDDSGTMIKEGGREGESIQFKIGGILADQTGTWHSGVNVNLNLGASSSTPLATPQAAPTEPATQTQMVLPASASVTAAPSTTPHKAQTAALSGNNSTQMPGGGTPIKPGQLIPRSPTLAPTSAAAGAVRVFGSAAPTRQPTRAAAEIPGAPAFIPTQAAQSSSPSPAITWLIVLLAAVLLALLGRFLLRKK